MPADSPSDTLPDYLARAADGAWVKQDGRAVGLIPRPAVDLVVGPTTGKRSPDSQFTADAAPQAQLRGEVAAQDSLLRSRVQRDFPEWDGSRTRQELNVTVGFALIKAELLAGASQSSASIAAAYDSVMDAYRPQTPEPRDGTGRTAELPDYLKVAQAPLRVVASVKDGVEFEFQPAATLITDGSKGLNRLLRQGFTPQRLAARAGAFSPDAVYQGQRRAELALADEQLGPKLRSDFGFGAGERVPRLVLKEMGGRLLLAELLAGAEAELADRRGEPSLHPTSSDAIADAYDAIQSRQPMRQTEVTSKGGFGL